MADTSNKDPRHQTQQGKSCCTKIWPILGIIILGIIAYVVINNSKVGSSEKDNTHAHDPSVKSEDNLESHTKEVLENVKNLVKDAEKEVVKDLGNFSHLDDKDVVAYLKEYNKSPESPQAADNLLKLALALGELKKYKESCAMLNKLETEYTHIPDSTKKKAQDAKLQYCK